MDDQAPPVPAVSKSATRSKTAKPRTDLLPPKLAPLFFRETPSGPVYIPSRYKIAKGGRGSAKSWGFGTVLVLLTSMFKLRVLCVRELQNSIQESVLKLLADRIEGMGLMPYFEVQRDRILGINDSEFIFAGIKTDPGKIKSMHDISICFVEEAEKVSESSWKTLIPTIRGRGSELWICFNPREETDATFKRFAVGMPPRARRVTINYDDNPWFPPELELERIYAQSLIRESKDDDERAQAQADYDHVWLGYCQKNSNASIFRRRVVIEDFDEAPERTRILFGADWGFANDPNALIRFWITDHTEQMPNKAGVLVPVAYQELWISHEAYGYRTEIDEIPALFDKLPDVRKWPIKGDCARPETISYVARQGFRITAAEKWPGSLEDGVAHIKGFRKIHIHTRCKKISEEARLYAYKVDRITGEVLPIILDKNNHGWDAVRYGLDGFIQRRGVAAQWARLAQ